MLVITRLPPNQRSAYAAHLKTLDASDRALRFGFYLADDAVDRHVAGLNLCRDVVLIACEGAAIVGAVHVTFYSESGSVPVASINLSVAATCRRRGVGKHLVEKAVSLAWADGASRALLNVARGNHAMVATARSCGLKEIEAGQFASALCADPSTRLAVASLERGIEVFRAGDTGRGVWLIHGAGGDAWQWRSSVMPALVKRGYSVEALTLRTLASCAANDRPSITSHVRDCLQVFRHQQPFMIVGHSIGAIVATRLATVVEPARVVLANPMPADGMSELDRAQSVGALDCPFAQKTLQQLSDYLPQPRLRDTQLTVVAGHHDWVSPPDYSARTVLHHRSPANRYDIAGGYQSIKTQRFADVVLYAAIEHSHARMSTKAVL